MRPDTSSLVPRPVQAAHHFQPVGILQQLVSQKMRVGEHRDQLRGAVREMPQPSKASRMAMFQVDQIDQGAVRVRRACQQRFNMGCEHGVKARQ